MYYYANILIYYIYIYIYIVTPPLKHLPRKA